MKALASDTTIKTYRFYKQNKCWYIDFPEFISEGLGTQADLMMVAGADTFLDLLSNNDSSVKVRFSDKSFDNCTGMMEKITNDIEGRISMLSDDGCGAYYNVTQYQGKPFKHQLWLCPVTLHIFDGQYPDKIYFGVV